LEVNNGKLVATWIYPKASGELGRFLLGDPPLEMSATAAAPGKFHLQNENPGAIEEGDLNRFVLQGDQSSFWISIGYQNPNNGLVYMEYVQMPGRPVLYLRTVRKDGKDIQTRANAEDYVSLHKKLSKEDKAALNSMLSMLTSKSLLGPPAAH
jgi:hypothetical protein